MISVPFNVVLPSRIMPKSWNIRRIEPVLSSQASKSEQNSLLVNPRLLKESGEISRDRPSDGLSERELLALVIIGFVAMWGTGFVLHQTPRLVLNYGDNVAYVTVSNAILGWNFHGLSIQHFMGYPYLIAAISFLFHISTSLSLWLIAAASALLSAWFAVRLVGTLPAVYFAITNLAWLQVAWIGGSEPLAMALGLGAMLAFRRNRVFLAALAGSLGVTVRPLMIFVLVGIGLVLLYRKQFLKFFLATSTGIVVGVLYILPLLRYFGDPFLTVHSYTRRDYGGGGIAGPHGRLFGWPFHGIVVGTMVYPAPWTNLVLSFAWIAIVIAGIGMMFSRRFREYGKAHPNEIIYCGFYLLTLFSYDYLLWARSNFIRFSIPVLPFIFLALMPWLPKNRKFLWCLNIACAVLAMISAIGLRNVINHRY